MYDLSVLKKMNEDQIQRNEFLARKVLELEAKLAILEGENRRLKHELGKFDELTMEDFKDD